MDDPHVTANIVDDDRLPLIHHVYPMTAREHVTDGTACWCDPHYYRLCTQCDGDEPDPECWVCDGEGLVRVDVIGVIEPMLIVHHFIPDDATFLRDGE